MNFKELGLRLFTAILPVSPWSKTCMLLKESTEVVRRVEVEGVGDFLDAHFSLGQTRFGLLKKEIVNLAQSGLSGDVFNNGVEVVGMYV